MYCTMLVDLNLSDICKLLPVKRCVHSVACGPLFPWKSFRQNQDFFLVTSHVGYDWPLNRSPAVQHHNIIIAESNFLILNSTNKHSHVYSRRAELIFSLFYEPGLRQICELFFITQKSHKMKLKWWYALGKLCNVAKTFMSQEFALNRDYSLLVTNKFAPIQPKSH